MRLSSFCALSRRSSLRYTVNGVWKHAFLAIMKDNNKHWKVREANDVAHAMISAYISGMCFKVIFTLKDSEKLILCFGYDSRRFQILIAALTWLFTFGFEKTGLYFLNESCWIIVRFPAISVSKRLFQLQHLNAGCGAAMFVLKHDRIRIRLAAFLLRRFFKFAKYSQKYMISRAKISRNYK